LDFNTITSIELKLLAPPFNNNTGFKNKNKTLMMNDKKMFQKMQQ